MTLKYFAILFALFCVRAIILGASFADGFILLVIGAYLIADKYLKSKSIQENYDEKLDKMEKELTKIQNNTESIKVAAGFQKIFK